jgi:hypothetical protein
MFRISLLTVCLLTATWQTALSQESPTSERKSTTAAVKYSAYGTAIPIVAGGALILAARSEGEEDDVDVDETTYFIGCSVGLLGAVVGPGLGHAHAGCWWHLAKGSAFRAVGAILIIGGIMGSDPSGMGCWGKPDEECEKDEGSNAGTIIIGSAIYLWSTIHDFRTLDDAVERYNQNRVGVTVDAYPTYFASENALGVVVSIGF